MLLSVPMIMALATACAPSVAPETLTAVVFTESGGDPLAIGVNRPKPYRLHPQSASDAARIADRLLAEGGNFDLGLGQINSRNLARLGLSAADAFNPCRNLAASAQLLAANFSAAVPITKDVQAALRTSLSLYNTGDPIRGFHNGYVAKVTASVRMVVPALDPRTGRAEPPPSSPPSPLPADWDVFARATPADPSFVIQPQSTEPSQ